MKRRLLPILSVACLAMAGVLACTYFALAMVTYEQSLPPGGEHFARQIVVGGGGGSVGVAVYHATSGQNGWHFFMDWSLPNPVAIKESWHSFEFSGSQRRFIVPAWFPIPFCLIPATLWWRRRRRERANVPGFPVEQKPEDVTTELLT